MGRRGSRELAFKLVFERLFNKNAEITESLKSIDDNIDSGDVGFAEILAVGVQANFDILMKKIEDNLKGYKIERVYKIDMAILLLALYEIEVKQESPAVIINEAVELAKKYSADKSPSFINGVLAVFVK